MYASPHNRICPTQQPLSTTRFADSTARLGRTCTFLKATGTRRGESTDHAARAVSALLLQWTLLVKNDFERHQHAPGTASTPSR